MIARLHRSQHARVGQEHLVLEALELLVGKADMRVDHGDSVAHVTKLSGELEERGGVQVIEQAPAEHDVEAAVALPGKRAHIRL
jgi:hypothetical protein